MVLFLVNSILINRPIARDVTGRAQWAALALEASFQWRKCTEAAFAVRLQRR